MTGSSLLGFIVSIIALFGVAAIFFTTIDIVAKDAVLAKIAKIAVGCLILIALVLAVASVLGFGGGLPAVDAYGVIVFAVGVLVLIVVLYLLDLFLGWLTPNMGLSAGIASAVRYIIAVVALIALLALAGEALLGGGVGDARHLPFHWSAIGRSADPA